MDTWFISKVTIIINLFIFLTGIKMTPANLAIGIFLFFHITVEILGNSSILFYYVFIIVTGKHLTPKDVIIEHLTFVNCLTTISKGNPETLSDFKYFVGDISCKLVVYMYQIVRGCPCMLCAYWVASKQLRQSYEGSAFCFLNNFDTTKPSFSLFRWSASICT